MSKVYLIPSKRMEDNATLKSKVKALWQKAGFDTVFKKNDLTALKLHVGEPGTETFVSPAIAVALVQCIKARGARPFLTDTSVLYRSRRDNAVDHARVAFEHGFGINRVGAPFIVADGLSGEDATEVQIGEKHYDKVSIAAAIMHARSILVLSHATGHLATGLGGALKNLGMGCAPKKAKLSQHCGQKPRIDPNKCRACGECALNCPSEAIEVGAAAQINVDLCIGCGECIATCLESAVKFDWSVMGGDLQERIVEHAAAVARAKKGRICFVTAAQGITKDCDCLGRKQAPLVDDIGILASVDPVAIDQVVLDLIEERAGRALESMSYPDTNGSIQLEYAEALGIGERKYDLITVQG
jgi:uncharacterized Fe-S center protein